MRWLITGGCRFLGTSLVRKLAEEGGHEVRVTDALSVGTREALGAACEFVERSADLGAMPGGESPAELVTGNILDEGLALQIVEGADVVVHLAANTGVAPSVENPHADCVTNVIGILNYLVAAWKNGAKRFVFASSGAPAGEVEPPIHEKLASHPASPYGASKLAGEGYCSAYSRTFGLKTVALRFGNVYGPGSGHKNSVVAKFIKGAMSGETLEIYGDGEQTRDFVYIADLVQAIRLAATAENVGGETFQIATKTETTVSELVEKLLPILECAGIGGVEVRHAASRTGDVWRNYSDTSKAQRMLGWRAEIGLEEGLRRTVEWFADPTRKRLAE